MICLTRNCTNIVEGILRFCATCRIEFGMQTSAINLRQKFGRREYEPRGGDTSLARRLKDGFTLRGKGERE